MPRGVVGGIRDHFFAEDRRDTLQHLFLVEEFDAGVLLFDPPLAIHNHRVVRGGHPRHLAPLLELLLLGGGAVLLNFFPPLCSRPVSSDEHTLCSLITQKHDAVADGASIPHILAVSPHIVDCFLNHLSPPLPLSIHLVNQILRLHLHVLPLHHPRLLLPEVLLHRKRCPLHLNHDGFADLLLTVKRVCVGPDSDRALPLGFNVNDAPQTRASLGELHLYLVLLSIRLFDSNKEPKVGHVGILVQHLLLFAVETVLEVGDLLP
mmetsp:Transcript_31233/g.76152  ORF Transcript_31233/g.76152 Transcript_31233/m.76152 type:complete len:263 (+) Transcript_31233:1204-1992(+)